MAAKTLPPPRTLPRMHSLAMNGLSLLHMRNCHLHLTTLNTFTYAHIYDTESSRGVQAVLLSFSSLSNLFF